MAVRVCTPAQECGIHTKVQCYPLAFGVPAALMMVALGKSDFFFITLCLEQIGAYC